MPEAHDALPLPQPQPEPPTAAQERQQEFDFNRAAQLRILERAVIIAKGPAKAVLKALDSYARESHESHPSIAEIARNAGISKNTARRTVHELGATLGLLTIIPRYRPNGSHASNSYDLLRF